MKEYLLTYFTNKTIDELDTIIDRLKTILPKGEIVNLFVERFTPTILSEYQITMSDKLVWAVNHTLQYAIDTEMLIRYIFDKIDRGDEE